MKKLSFCCSLALIILFGCKREPHQSIKGYSYSPLGYHYKLISFVNLDKKPKPLDFAWLDIIFKTLNDSVFWDSGHDAANKYIIRLNDSISSPLLIKHLFRLSEGDSVSCYYKPRDLFKFYFRKDVVPFFCERDSLVKAEIKLKKILGLKELESLSADFQSQEEETIKGYLSQQKDQGFTDDFGITWLQHDKINSDSVRQGSNLSISYKGYFLDGKLIDFSNGNFNFIYGTPDQILKGLNFVIKQMRKGEYAKIILPSYLAYGKSGSSNGVIPPFTPLLYEINLTEVK
jgi:FKBP-type peptidyl-prolyl cis-trans isomerase FkpA